MRSPDREEEKGRRRRFDAAILLFAVLGFTYSAFRFAFPESRESDATRAALGRVAWFDNDLRRKSASQLSWNPARREQSLALGDSIFTGEKSSSRLELVSGSVIELGEKSLVTFVEADGIRLPALSEGNFRLEVKGGLRVSVGGEVYEISADAAELQIFVAADGRPVFRNLTPGRDVRIRHRGGEMLVKSGLHVAAAPVTAELRPTAPVLRPAEGESHLTLPLRFEHVYAIAPGGGLTWSEPGPMAAPATLRIAWSVKPAGSLVSIESSSDPSFRDVSFRAQTTDEGVVLEKLRYGDNYWRLSTDGKTWSPPARARVETRPWESPGLAVSLPSELELRDGFARGEAFLGTEERAVFFVLETAPTPDFLREETRVQRVDGGGLSLSFRREGVAYYRARAVNAAGELSVYSAPVRLVVRTAPPPRLARKPAPPAREVAAAAPEPPPVAPEPVVSAPASLPAPAVSARIETPPVLNLNRQYRDSVLQLEGAGLAMYSRAEIARGNEVKAALSASVRDVTWFGSHGVEGRVKSAVLSPVEGGSSTAPFSVEGRYRYRWLLGFNPFPGPEESTVSWLAGFESYRNHGSALMSAHYDLLKTGAAFDFPLWRAMDTGGELLYGQSADRSKKYEIAGHVHFHVKTGWSLGVGYRVHLFEAGGESSSPLGLPYREGYGEGYSVLRWHY